ncbi:MAG: TnsA endonuclease N-terminal domain-containing protein [Marinisporobacter sp.]|nr:TnsA endonuclease N-terminal domain-containing protein [Marinisporobacter sp.]
MPINIKRNTWYGSNYWEVYSNKIKRRVRLFSNLEYENWILLETNPKVKTFCEQPLRIQGWFEGKIFESIFDMWVCYYDDYEEFLEVKYSHELDISSAKSERSIRQTTIQGQWCKKNNKNYRVITEKEIRNNRTYLNNLKQILYFTKSQEKSIKNCDKDKILKNIPNTKIKIIDILNKVTEIEKENALRIIYTLILENRIFSDIADKVLTYETGVWKNE